MKKKYLDLLKGLDCKEVSEFINWFLVIEKFYKTKHKRYYKKKNIVIEIENIKLFLPDINKVFKYFGVNEKKLINTIFASKGGYREIRNHIIHNPTTEYINKIKAGYPQNIKNMKKLMDAFYKTKPKK